MNKKRVFLAVLVLALLGTAGCVKITPSVVYHDQSIPNEVRSAVHGIADEILLSLRENNPDVLKKYMYGSETEAVAEAICGIYSAFESAYANVDFQSLTESYSPSKTQMFTILSVLDSYRLNIPIGRNEAYLLVYGGELFAREDVLTFVLVKQATSWQVLHLYMGHFKAFGMGVEEWAEQARGLYNEGLVMPAFLHQQIALELSQLAPILPHRDSDQYQRDLEKYGDSVSANFEFPMSIDLGDATVQLFGVEPIIVGRDFAYSVNYISSYGSILQNEDSIENESRTLHSRVIELFPGIERYIDAIVYTAFEELPADSDKSYTLYRTVVELGQR